MTPLANLILSTPRTAKQEKMQSNKTIQATETLLINTGNIIKCKQLTKQLFDTLADEMVESIRHCLASLAESSVNQSPAKSVEYTHENHSSVVSAEDAKNVRTVVKVFLAPGDDDALRQAVEKTLSQLCLQRIDLLLVAFAHPTGSHKLELHHMQPTWSVCESLVSQGVVGSAGVADLDVTQLRDLYQWASKRVKPTTNQLHFESAIALSAEMTEFAAEYNIQLLTHADEIGTAGPVNVKRMLDGFKDDADKWHCSWLTRYTVTFRCRGVLHSKGYIAKIERDISTQKTRGPQ
ncbi:glutamate--cysteine ligase regulatory subunit-like isoform X2 [Varroa jacobsoni]|uniref:GCS light chain n=1 Tax=Varroa destructor TaxID=109461 RepID=A0A7M7JRV7_VARDE|nr:glutamate--cysteine ligase regulatory subunit-like isoform X2 [Varroa destructor]XP_022690060.1 glutamate--cysteine ligase regulatory subunit-like isoform X2 [Varroa jacobsoni]